MDPEFFNKLFKIPGSSLICSAETGDPAPQGGGAGDGGDGGNPGEGAPAAPAPPAASPEPAAKEPTSKVFSQAEVDAIVKDRLARQKRSLESKKEEKTPQKQPAPAGDSAAPLTAESIQALVSSSVAEAVVAALGAVKEIEQETESFATLAKARNIPATAIEPLRVAWSASDKPDLSEWLDGIAAGFAPPPAAEPPKATTESAPATAPAKPTPPDGGPASAQRRPEDLDISELTREDIERHGSGKVRDMVRQHFRKQSGSLPQVFRPRGAK